MPARNDVPVNMGDLIAETGKIDFLGPEHLAHDALDRKNNNHQALAIVVAQIGHLCHVRIPNHASKTRKVRVLGINNGPLIGFQEKPGQWVCTQCATTGLGQGRDFVQLF